MTGQVPGSVKELELSLGSRGATRRLGRRLASVLDAGDLIVLEGSLGAGKTFLARSVARGLGVPANVRVTSPTFELVHEFATDPPLLHVDLYRLDDAAELGELGLFERVSGDAVVLVEWGDRFASALGNDGLWLWLYASRQQDSGRRCRLQGRGARGGTLFDRLVLALDAAPVQ